MAETLAPPAPAPTVDIPIAVNPGEATVAGPGTVDLASVRQQLREGKVPDLSAPAQKAQAPIAAAPAPAAPAKDDVDDDQPGTAPSPKNRRVSQEYLNDLVASRARAELRAEQMDERIRALEGTGQPAAPAQPEHTRLMPTEDEVGTTYKTYGDYVADVTKWQIEQVDAARTRAERDSSSQAADREAIGAYQSKIPAAKTRHADFDEVIARPLPAPLTQMLRSALLASDLGPDLAYHLTTHPDEYTRLRALPVGLALMAIGRLEAQLQAAITAPAAAAPINPAPLPAPMAPVGGHPTAGTPDLSGNTIDLRVVRSVIKPKFGMSSR